MGWLCCRMTRACWIGKETIMGKILFFIVLFNGVWMWVLFTSHHLSLFLQQAFWCLVQICEKYLPGYYSAGLVSDFTHSYFLYFTFCSFVDSTFPCFRKRSSWMARSSSLCYGVRVPWRTDTWRSSRLIRFSTWPNGLCASSHAPYHGPVCCVCGTCSSVKVF